MFDEEEETTMMVATQPTSDALAGNVTGVDNGDGDVDMETVDNDDKNSNVDDNNDSIHMNTKKGNKSSKSKPTKTTMSMKDWFLQSTLEECDAMSAIQLEYRFKGDNMGNMWWKVFQEVGFTYTSDQMYLAPMPTSTMPAVERENGNSLTNPVANIINTDIDSGKKSSQSTSTSTATTWPFFRSRVFDAHELFSFLDKFAIPELHSSLQDIPGCGGSNDAGDNVDDDGVLSNMTQREIQYWRSIRDELLYRQFHSAIEPSDINADTDGDGRITSRGKNNAGSNHSKKKNGKNGTTGGTTNRRSSRQPAPVTSYGMNGRSVTESEPGAELYLRKPKPKRKSTTANNHLGAERDGNNFNEEEHDDDVTFPTIEQYAEQMKAENKLYSLQDIEAIEAEIATKCFDEWKFLLTTNHSLLLYGLGSKRTILNQFAYTVLGSKSYGDCGANGDLLVLDGYDKDITISDILDLIVDYWLDGDTPESKDISYKLGVNEKFLSRSMARVGVSYPSNQLVDRDILSKAICISRALSKKVEFQPSKSRRPLYLVIHTMDGIGLRNHTSQQALAALVHHSYLDNGMNVIRLIASIDHVNAPAVLWNSCTRSSFNWMWKQVHTYRPYVEETTESNLVDIEQSIRNKKRGKRSSGTTGERRVGFAAGTADPVDDRVFSVLQSLSPRHTEALKQLAELQLEEINKMKEAAAAASRSDKDTSSKGKKKKNDYDNEIWVNYIDLMRQCQLKCVATDQALRNYLKELCDQEIVEKRQNTTSSVQLYYRIPYPKDRVVDILEYQQQQGTNR